jgi:hypothetical protein
MGYPDDVGPLAERHYRALIESDDSLTSALDP